MIHPTRAQFPTSSMEISSREARRLLSMEPINPLISTTHTTIPHGTTNEHIVTFTYEDGSRESFNGREWRRTSPNVSSSS